MVGVGSFRADYYRSSSIDRGANVVKGVRLWNVFGPIVALRDSSNTQTCRWKIYCNPWSHNHT